MIVNTADCLTSTATARATAAGMARPLRLNHHARVIGSNMKPSKLAACASARGNAAVPRRKSAAMARRWRQRSQSAQPISSPVATSRATISIRTGSRLSPWVMRKLTA